MSRCPKAFLCILLVVLFSAPLALFAQAHAQKAFAVVELFTSEGCSSCPPADEALFQLVREADEQKLTIYALEWHVDYWDYLGWKDPWDSKFATARQYAYARSLPSSVYTPQVVINGQYVPSYAGDLHELEAEARSVATEPTKVMIRLVEVRQDSPAAVHVSLEVTGAPHDSNVLLAAVEGDLRSTPNAGENAGRRLLHSNVVRAAKMVTPDSKEVTLDVPVAEPGTTRRIVALLESSSSLHILAATQLRIPSPGDSELSGQIIDGAGKPVPEALIKACGASLCIPAKTDEAGYFSLQGMRNGSYEIDIDLPASVNQRDTSSDMVVTMPPTAANVYFSHLPAGVLITKTVWQYIPRSP